MKKRRITVTLDADIIDDILESLSNGGEESLSGWVNEAVRRRREDEIRLAWLADAVKSYEAENGEITEDEMQLQEQRDRDFAAASRAGHGVRQAG